MDSTNIMGVVVPQIESAGVGTDLDERGYGLVGTASRIDELADAYEQLLETIVRAAEVETTLQTLLDEIETTKRRVNALEHNLLPELHKDREYIEERLEEQRREEIFRMKLIKEKKLEGDDEMEPDSDVETEVGAESEREQSDEKRLQATD